MKISPNGCKNQSSNKGIAQASGKRNHVQHITTEAEFDALREDWQRLYRECPQAGLFNSWYWNRLWWQHYGDTSELFIIVIRIDDIVQGIAPFYCCKTKALKLLEVATLRFIGSGGDTSPDDLCVLHAAAHEHEVIVGVCQYVFESQACMRLQLSDLDENSLLVNTLLSMGRSHRWGKPLKRYQHRHVDVLPASITSFEQGLSRNARKQRKRRRHRLYQVGDIQFKTCEHQSELPEAFNTLLRLHELRHESKGGSDSFQTQRYCNFHFSVMEAALANKELRLLELKIDGKTIGIEYAFLCRQVLSFFQTGFDPQYQQLSPGHLLMAYTIDHAIADGARKIDLLKGNYEYKRSYAKQTRTTVDLDIWKSPLIAHALRIARSVIEWP